MDPKKLRYATTHEWASLDGGTCTVGITKFAVEQLTDLVYVELPEVGDHVFGQPARITAVTAMGRAGIINIEREAEMSGAIHTKGVLILAGFLRSRFAQDKPLALSASVCFEQSYGAVEGDSASAAELFALLSSLSGVPLRQGIVVTGSVNQRGEIQPIGGVSAQPSSSAPSATVRPPIVDGHGHRPGGGARHAGSAPGDGGDHGPAGHRPG
jgi:hypothetical protein